jgi:hypothetical protein
VALAPGLIARCNGWEGEMFCKVMVFVSVLLLVGSARGQESNELKVNRFRFIHTLK